MIETGAYIQSSVKHLEVESFAKIVKSFFKKITIFKRNSILEIFDRQDSEYVSVNMFQLYSKSTFVEHLNQWKLSLIFCC